MRRLSKTPVELAVTAIVTIAEACSVLLFIAMIAVWCIVGGRV